MPRLLDPDEMAVAFGRSLGEEAATPEVRIRYLRYKPRKDLVVLYDVTVDGVRHDAVAIIAARRDLSRWATEPTYVRLADLVDGRAPAPRPLSYDPELNAMIQWLPLDISLPALAQEPSQLRMRLQAAGVSIAASGEGPRMLAYKPRRRAVLQLDGHVVKIYAGGRSSRMPSRARHLDQPRVVARARARSHGPRAAADVPDAARRPPPG